MRRRVGVVIGLDLDDDAADALEQQRRADQFGRDLVDAAVEEALAQPGGIGSASTVTRQGIAYTMRMFLAGAAGAIGRRLTPLLV